MPNINWTQLLYLFISTLLVGGTGGGFLVKGGVTAKIHAGMKTAKRKVLDAIAAPIQALQQAAADKAAAAPVLTEDRLRAIIAEEVDKRIPPTPAMDTVPTGTTNASANIPENIPTQ